MCGDLYCDCECECDCDCDCDCDCECECECEGSDRLNGLPSICVFVFRFVNYYKIQYAQLCINENKDCEFIATNLDAVTHLTDAQEWAGNGSMVGAIKGCTGVEPTVVGKPGEG